MRYFHAAAASRIRTPQTDSDFHGTKVVIWERDEWFGIGSLVLVHLGHQLEGVWEWSRILSSGFWLTNKFVCLALGDSEADPNMKNPGHEQNGTSREALDHDLDLENFEFDRPLRTGLED
jgi:hypothetical protein